jgi:DNA-binding transcriptional regulator YhcF (GntR family)
MAAQIGMNAFGVWLAIKSHADFNDGEAWPGIRKLAEMTGLGKSTVDRTIQTLIDAKLLRVLDHFIVAGNEAISLSERGMV